MSTYKSFSFTENIDLLQNIQLEASAGTGKTYSIERIVTLLIARSSLNISNILIVTFTKKAARELKERIRIIFHETLQSGKLDLGATSLIFSDEELENLQRSYREFEKASILTIHSFCLNMLKAYPFESLSQFSMEMDSDGDMTGEAVWDYMREIGSSMDPELLLKYRAFLEGKNFDEAVSNLASAINKELLDPLVERIPDDNLINETSSSVLDFNNKKGDLYNCWLELNKNIPDLNHLDDLGFKYAKNKIKKLSLLETISGKGDLISISKSLSKEKVLNTLVQFLPENLEANLKKGIDMETVEGDLFVQSVENFLNLYTYDSEKPENNLYEQILKASFLFDSYSKIKKRVNRKKDISGKLDFNDLISRLHRALCGGGNERQPLLTQEIRKRYRTVLVDEFQDTDNRQWDIFNTLFGQDSNHNFFLVGDPKQSIYGFRGADLEIYYQACQGDSVKHRYTLDKNFRSISSLVAGINIVFSKVFHEDMHCGFTAVTPFNEVLSGKDDEAKLEDDRSPLEFIRVESVYDSEKGISKLKASKDLYFKMISYKIFKLLHSETVLKGRVVRPGDIAILTESNKDCQVLQDLLISYSIPSVITARETVFDTVEAGEFLIFLQAMVRMNNSSIKLLLLSLFFGFTPGDIERFELDGSLDFFSAQIYRWRDAVDRGHLIEVCFDLFSFRDLPGLDLTFEERLLSRKNGERSYTNFRQILEYLHKEQQSSRLDAEELFTLLSNNISGSSGGEDNLLRLDKDSEAVQIMTMHASKGLEFPLVFFAGAIKKDMKSSSSDMYNFVDGGKRHYDFLKMEKNRISQSMDLWEERKRLYYVALTRASSKLYMPYIQNCDFSYLSSLFSSFCIEDIERILTDNAQVQSFSLPLHSGLSLKSSDKGKTKKAILTIIDDSVNSLVNEHSHLFSMDNSLEGEYFNQQTPGALCYEQNRDKVALEFCPLKSQEGFTARYRRISSYSSIIRDKTVKHYESSVHDDADRDEISGTASVSTPGDPILTRGAQLGELVHMIFEQLEYSKVEQFTMKEFMADEKLDLLFKSLSVRFFNNKWYQKFFKQLKELVYRTLKNNLFEGFPLCRLNGDEKIHELEFYMTVKDCDNLNLGDFNGFVEKGFLKGFIDMIFKYNGKIYIVDWKTTSSPEGDLFENYHQNVISEMMETHHYNLQSMIYMVALCKYLTTDGESSFDYETDFGGCYYLFVRGIKGEGDSDTGIYFHRPSRNDLLAFAGQFTHMELGI